MKKIILNKQQVGELVFENRYPVEGDQFLSRCIDGRYDKNIKNQPSPSRRAGQISKIKNKKSKRKNQGVNQNKPALKTKEEPLPALAIPGGDLGELALILATGNAFGFAVDGGRAFESLVEVVGGEENFHFHTDEHYWSKDGLLEISPQVNPSLLTGGSSNSHSHRNFSPSSSSYLSSQTDYLIASTKFEKGQENFPSPSFLTKFDGCGHWREIQSNPAGYHLEEKDINFIREKLRVLTTTAEKTRQLVILHGEHKEAAILIVKGNYGIYPHYTVFDRSSQNGNLQPVEVQVFVYQQTLANQRRRLLAKKLIEKKAVTLYPGCDEEYLYEVLSDEAENHLFETLKRLAKNLPIFEVKFKNDGEFEVEERGEVS
ncbi:MAG: hypothetical protein ACK4FL_00890 [Microgenomates group bacterium]